MKTRKPVMWNLIKKLLMLSLLVSLTGCKEQDVYGKDCFPEDKRFEVRDNGVCWNKCIELSVPAKYPTLALKYCASSLCNYPLVCPQ